MAIFNAKFHKMCAFCEYWYDPTQKYISPQNARANIWSYDKYAWSSCIKYNLKKNAQGYCKSYKCRVPVFGK